MFCSRGTPQQQCDVGKRGSSAAWRRDAREGVLVYRQAEGEEIACPSPMECEAQAVDGVAWTVLPGMLFQTSGSGGRGWGPRGLGNEHKPLRIVMPFLLRDCT